MSDNKKVESVDSYLGYGEFTHDQTQETKWGANLMVVGFASMEEAKLFCDALAPVVNKEFSLNIQPMGQPAANDSGLVH